MPTVYFKSYASTPPSGGNLIPWVSIDGGAFSMRSERPTLISSTSGWYKLDLSIFVVSWDIVVEADHVTDLTSLEALTSQILGLAGHFSVSGDVLTAYNADGTTNRVYDLTRDASGTIMAIAPRSTQS